MNSVSEIKSCISTVRKNIKDIERFHKESLANVSSSQATKFSEAVKNLGDETDNLLQTCRVKVKSLRNVTSSMPNTSNKRLRMTQERAIANDLIAVVNEYRTVQLKYKDQHVQKFARQYQIVKPNATQREINEAVQESSQNDIFAQEMVQSNRTQAQESLRAVRARHADIKQIERSVVQLVGLMEEMQFMLDQQQEILDQVDIHIDNAAANMQQGSTQVSKAIKSRLSARKRAWCLCVFTIILLIVAGILIYFYAVKPMLDAQQAKTPNSTPTPA
jgi:syntaxin 1B/2/3